ncbi:hypothetical protein LCGC14_1774670 [marine sediment metagenome]|uniref:Uncharacterized protein n=1 Tax=marine sediment metagenome TaxID=412755 RepID=A0A0F9GX67_9ZZZZ|nr:hypothetical protein [Methylophaga sp.]
MQVGDIEKYLGSKCDESQLKKIIEAINVLIDSLPRELISELCLTALKFSVNVVLRTKGNESVKDLLNRLCKKYHTTADDIHSTAIDVAMQTISSLEHGEIFDMLGLEEDEELFKFVDIEMIMDLQYET